MKLYCKICGFVNAIIDKLGYKCPLCGAYIINHREQKRGGR